MGFIPGMQRCLNICKSSNMIYPRDKMKDTNHIIISRGTEKTSAKTKHALIKFFNKT